MADPEPVPITRTREFWTLVGYAALDEAAADRLEVTYFANPASRQEAASLAAVSSE